MRLFFSLWPPSSVSAALAAVAHDSARQFGGRPTRKDTLHLTLAFLGEVPEAQVPGLIEMAQAIRQEPFALTIDRIGYWKRNRLLWAGCESVPEQLLALVADLRERLSMLGVSVDAGEFTPHVTLVRSCQPAAGLSVWQEIKPVPWQAGEFVLVRSCPTSAGASYQCLANFPLARH